jgi:predicted DNA-binding protein (UPF0251 family)
MPRPRKRRILGRLPRPAIYKPAGIPLDDLNQVRLLQEELEALRLADLEALTQTAAAEQMGISRSTFQRILSRAHRQVALALSDGYALKIVGVELERPSNQSPTAENKSRKRRH